MTTTNSILALKMLDALDDAASTSTPTNVADALLHLCCEEYQETVHAYLRKQESTRAVAIVAELMRRANNENERKQIIRVLSPLECVATIGAPAVIEDRDRSGDDDYVPEALLEYREEKAEAAHNFWRKFYWMAAIVVVLVILGALRDKGDHRRSTDAERREQSKMLSEFNTATMMARQAVSNRMRFPEARPIRKCGRVCFPQNWSVQSRG